MPDVIRERRTEIGMSQRDLADAAGVDVRQIRRYEAGEQHPLLSVAVAIADGYLNMSGRWVGLGYDGRIMTGFGTMGQTQEEAEATMRKLISSEGVAYADA